MPEIQSAEELKQAIIHEIDAAYRPPVFYDDGSFTLETMGCSCCSHDMEAILKLGWDKDVDESKFRILMGLLSAYDKKAIQVAWLKKVMTALKLTKEDL